MSPADNIGLLSRLVRTFPGLAYRCLHDADWTLEFVSEGAAELLGYTPDELVIDRLVAVSELVHPDDLAKVSLEIEKRLSVKEPFGAIYRMRTRDGTYKWISEVGRGVFDDRGNLEAIEGFLSDVTAEVESQEAVRIAERREMVARLASGIAHDFNNIITGILASVSLARDGIQGDGNGAAAELDTIADLVERATGLTRQLLDFGRPGSAETDPIDLVRELRKIDTLLGRLLGPKIVTVMRLPSATVNCRIDRVRLEQVIVNLAVNARDAMPKGGRLQITLSAADSDDHATLTVTDFGDGIEPSKLARVFEPYFTSKETQRGTGLGLATVRSIVEETGGSITVSSELERGTTFEIVLPLTRASKVASSEPFGTEVVLYAEDEEVVRTAVARGLRRLGYTVLVAPDGEQALKISERHKGPLDVLVTDGRMPNLGGIELAQKLAEMRPGLPAILITGDRRRGPEGLFAFEFEKPLTVDALAGHVRRLLDGAG